MKILNIAVTTISFKEPLCETTSKELTSFILCNENFVQHTFSAIRRIQKLWK